MTLDKNKKNAAIGRLALLGTTLVWGTSFVVLKSTLDSISTLYILAFRFTGAALLMALLGIRELKNLDRGYLKGGALMGVFLFIAYVFQTYGLVYTTPGKNAFLTATYCVIVPFLAWAMHKKRPDSVNVLAALMAIVGIGLVSLNEDLSIGFGEGLTTCSGLFFALHIVVTAKESQGRSPAVLTMVQFTVAGVLAWTFALITEPFPTSVPANAWTGLVYLCVMCTAVAFLLQTIGQKYTPPSTVAIMLTLESVFGTIFSVVIYGEQLNLQLIAGFAIIFTAILISETKLEFLRRGKKAVCTK